MAFTSVAALVAGEAATATLVLGAVTEIGLAMTVVGAVTGEKGLMKLGGVLSMVGGVGGMINGMAGGAAGAVTEGATGATGDFVPMGAAEKGFSAAADTGLTSTGTAGATAGIGGATTSAVTSAGDWTSMLDDAQKSLGSLDTTGGVTSPASEVDAFTKQAAETVKPADAAAKTESLIGTEAPKDFVPSGAQAQGYSPAMDSNAAFNAMPPANSKDYFQSFLNWVKQNKEVSNGILTLGSGALKGMNDRSMFDEKMALENKKYGYGNQVANFRGAQPQPLIGAR